MRTPVEYTDNLKKRIITRDMLSDALYSVNKRAKNWRNKKREYRGIPYDKFHNFEKAEEQESLMYARKERLLSLLNPACIHKEPVFSEIKVYDYEKRFDQRLLRALRERRVKWWSSFVQRRPDYLFWLDEYELEELGYSEENTVFFFTMYGKEKTGRYYLYYPYGEHSYHAPISAEEAKEKEKNGLPIITIEQLNTDGMEIKDMISVPFVDKLIELIDSGDYQLQSDVPVTALDRYKAQSQKSIEAKPPRLSSEEAYRVLDAVDYMEEKLEHIAVNEAWERSKSAMSSRRLPVLDLQERIECKKKTMVLISTFLQDNSRFLNSRNTKKREKAVRKLLASIEALNSHKLSYGSPKPPKHICRSEIIVDIPDRISIDALPEEVVREYIDRHPECIEEAITARLMFAAKKKYAEMHETEWKKEALEAIRNKYGDAVREAVDKALAENTKSEKENDEKRDS